MNRSLLIGPLPPPINGQSKCFQTLTFGIGAADIVDRNVSEYNLVSKIWKYGSALIRSLFYVLFVRVDVVYISISRNWMGLSFDALMILLSRLVGAKVILHLHGNDFLVSSLKKKIFSKTHSLCNTFIALSDPMKKRIQDSLTCDVITVTNPIDEVFLSDESLHNTQHINVVFLSNIMKSKGISDFISVAKRMEENISYRFHIVGKPMSDELCSSKDILNELNLAQSQLSNLQYHGCKYGGELSTFLTSMDILLFPSFYRMEALPLSVLECAAMGIYPIINKHNDLVAFEGLLDHVSLMDTSDYELVVNAIIALDKEKIKDAGISNRKRCVQYSKQNHVLQMRKLFFN